MHTCPFKADATSAHVLLKSVQLPHIGEKNSTSHTSESSRAARCFSVSRGTYGSASTMTIDLASSDAAATARQAAVNNNDSN